MVVVPATYPVTNPVILPTPATVVLLLLHVPAGVASLRLIVAPAHTALLPVMFSGEENTVSVAVVIHPVESI